MVVAGGASDPVGRIPDMEIDGIGEAVLFPTYGLMIQGETDPDIPPLAIPQVPRDTITTCSGSIQIGNRAHRVLTWQHDRLRARGRWWLVYLWTEATIDSDVLMIIFDEDDLVSSAGVRRAADD